MKTRYVTAKNGKLDELINEIDDKLQNEFEFELPYMCTPQVNKTIIFYERLYERAEGTIKAIYYLNKQMPMINLQNEIKGYCDGVLYFLSMDSELNKKIDAAIPSVKIEEL